MTASAGIAVEPVCEAVGARSVISTVKIGASKPDASAAPRAPCALRCPPSVAVQSPSANAVCGEVRPGAVVHDGRLVDRARRSGLVVDRCRHGVPLHDLMPFLALAFDS